MQKTGLNPAADRELAFAQFFVHRAMLRAYLRAILRDGDLVEDTLSDVAVEVARCWDAYDPAMPFAPWARGVARRLALKKLQRRQRHTNVPEDVLEALGAAMDQIGDRLTVEGQKQQLVLCLVFIDLLDEAGEPVEAVRVHAITAGLGEQARTQRRPRGLETQLREHALEDCVQIFVWDPRRAHEATSRAASIVGRFRAVR